MYSHRAISTRVARGKALDERKGPSREGKKQRGGRGKQENQPYSLKGGESG